MLASHGGFMRVKLCKLNGPSDIATQECFDQNVLKIQPLNNSMDGWKTVFYGNSYQQQGGIFNAASSVNSLDTLPLIIDEYTIRDPEVTNQNIDVNILWEIFISVQLPGGLTCDNCVFQWDYYQRYAGYAHGWKPCMFANGTILSEDTSIFSNICF